MQVILTLAHKPSRREGVGGHCQCQQIGIAPVHTLQHLGRIATNLHTQAHTQMAGKTLAKQIVHAQVTAMIIVIGVGPRQRQGYQFAGTFYLLQVENIGHLCLFHPRRNDRLFLRLTARKKHKKQHKYSVMFQSCTIFGAKLHN